MDDLDLGAVLENDVDANWITLNSNRISEKILDRSSTLVQLVEHLGPALTNNRPQIRCHALNLLTSTLELLQTSFLQKEEVELLVNFYTDRLRDHHSAVPSTVRGLYYLSKCEELNKEMLQILLDRMFRELMLQQQVVRDRSVVFNMLANLLYNRLELVKHVETQFIVGFLQVSEGEKDPRNLMIIFQCTSFILEAFNVDHLREDVFESLAVYFPIDFTPPKGINASVTKSDLILALRSGLSAPSLADFSIPLFMEKLDSDLESAKEDSVASLLDLVSRCSKIDTGKSVWLTDNGKLLELVWKGLKKELLGIRLRSSECINKGIYNLITKISAFLGTQTGGLTNPTHSSGFHIWFNWIIRDLKPHLETAGTKLMQGSVDILTAVSESGKEESKEVLSQSLPILVQTYDSAAPSAKPQLLDAITVLLTAAAYTGLVMDMSSVYFDKLFAVYLESANLLGLSSAAGLLSKNHRKELCDHLILGVKDQNKSLGPAILRFASWDEDLTETIILPQLLSLHDSGLITLSHLLVVHLLDKFLLQVSIQVKENKYSAQATQVFFKQLSKLDCSSDVRSDLSDQVPEILNNFLNWTERPTVDVSADDEYRCNFCVSLQQVASLITSAAQLEQLQLENKLSTLSLSPGEISEIEAIVSSLNPKCLSESQDLVSKMLKFPGIWRTKASLVNKQPDLADLLLQQQEVEDVDVDGIGSMSHALLLCADHRANHWIQKLMTLLHHPDKGEVASKCFEYLCLPADWKHARTSLLFRQRLWSLVQPELLEEASKPENTFHLASLLYIIPQIPTPLLEPKLGSLLPLLVRGLKEKATSLSALLCLDLILDTAPSLISSHTRDIVERCLLLTNKENPLQIRMKSLVCLRKIGMSSNPDTISLSYDVTQHLTTPLQDHKRVVREVAAKARNRWFLLAQP